MKKFTVAIFASLVLAGTAVVAIASEDFGPGENPNLLQGAHAGLPESYVPSPDTPVLSIEDYQSLNDAMGNPTENSRRVPAYGSDNVTVSALLEEDMDDIAVAAVPENNVPITDQTNNAAVNPIAGELNPNTTDNAQQNTHNTAPGTTTHPNPNTGAPNMLAPVLTAILSLAAAPIVIKGRRI